MITKLTLNGSDTANLKVSVPSNLHPSRWLFFRPIGNDAAQMAAYHKPIYDSCVVIALRNHGTHSFTLKHLGKEQNVAVGETVKLTEVDFKDFRLLIAPYDGQQANFHLKIKFDSAYRTNAWKLMAAWSDGP